MYIYILYTCVCILPFRTWFLVDTEGFWDHRIWSRLVRNICYCGLHPLIPISTWCIQPMHHSCFFQSRGFSKPCPVSSVIPTELQATTTLGILGQTRAPWAVLDSNMPIWIFRPVRKCTMEDLFFLPCVLWVGGACLTSQLAFLVSVLEDFLTVSTWVPRLLRTLFVFSRFWLCKHIVFRSGLFELPVPGTTMARGGSWFLFSLAQTWANEGRMQPRQERLQGEGQGVRTSEFSQKG